LCIAVRFSGVDVYDSFGGAAVVLVWIVLCLLLIGVELHHLAFFAMFGAAGAAAASVVAIAAPSHVLAQACVAVGVSTVGVVFVRPQVSQAFARRGPGTAVRGVHGGLVGARGLTVDEVRLDGRGHVRMLGETWLAVTADGSSIPPSTAVIVTNVVGTTLTVRAAEETWELT
jgi:membrane protein implicated in regulation of membrane protease activity